jgi:hypothetical protein
MCGISFWDKVVLNVEDFTADLAVAIFKVNAFGRDFGSTCIALTLGSVLEVKL